MSRFLFISWICDSDDGYAKGDIIDPFEFPAMCHHLMYHGLGVSCEEGIRVLYDKKELRAMINMENL